MSLTTPPLSLYVHVPWCVRKCPYCDFNSHEGRGELPLARYVDALIADLDHDLPLVWGRTVQTVFFGGGTPSLMPADLVDRFLQQASSRLRFAPGCEITLEANPGTAEFGHLAGYRAAGVNRLSFGIQSFDDGCLARLGRIHDAAQAIDAVRQAQDTGFDNLNLDLMYALPGQDLAMALRDIEQAISLAPAHISHYQLTLEPNTVFASRPPKALPDDDLAWDMQEHCQARLAHAAYSHYETSAYARDGRYCAHNLNYWRFGDYLGIGAGAHGKVSLGAQQTLLRRWKHKHPTRYLDTAGTAAALGGDEMIEPARRPFEFMLNALRLHEGYAWSMFEARTGLPRSAVAVPVSQAIARGWLIDDGMRVMPTESGRRFTNDVLELFLDTPVLADIGG
ncbi:MAG: radical SAM family heme chaperone HemW [Lysobacter sp.]|nr:MAG: radical SAM family heme chaperone HemW [Lysobacter sp.]